MSYLTDGFSATMWWTSYQYALSLISFTPPSIEGGGGVAQTGMDNEGWRTQLPKSLKKVGAVTGLAYYDTMTALELHELRSAFQQLDVIWVEYSNGQQFVFYGWLDLFQPNAFVEGQRPTVNLVWYPSCTDGVGSEFPYLQFPFV